MPFPSRNHAEKMYFTIPFTALQNVTTALTLIIIIKES